MPVKSVSTGSGLSAREESENRVIHLSDGSRIPVMSSIQHNNNSDHQTTNVNAPQHPQTHSHKTLQYGSQGESVHLLQKILNMAILPSPHLREDGIFGSCTELAVIHFQAAHNLVVDGIVGPNTWAAMEPFHSFVMLTSWMNGGGGPGQATAPKPHHKPAPKPVPPVTGGHGNPLIIRRNGKTVPHFRQWEYGSDMGTSGCAVTSMAMVMAYYGRDVKPGQLRGYLGSCFMDWNRACQCGGGNHSPVLTTQWDIDKPGYQVSSRRPKIMARLAKGLPTIAWVDYKGARGEGNGDHFVVVVGVAPDGSLIMNDPAAQSSGASHWQDRNNRIETCSKKYKIVGLCSIDAV